MKLRHSLTLLLGLMLASCSSLEYYAIDYLKPGDISFPASYRKVGIVNAVQERPSSLEGKFNDLPNVDGTYYYHNTSYVQSNGQSLASELASAIAQEGYFEEVILLDSAVVTPGAAMGRLSQEQVTSLSEYLGVDFVLSVEDLQVRREDLVSYDDYYGFYIGTTDAKVAPRIGIYYPTQASGNAITVQPLDSIFWETPGTSAAFTKQHLLSNEQMVREASQYSSELILERILPSWHSDVRYYTSGGSLEMRDAAVSVKESDWETAISLWKKAYAKKSEKAKMKAALNLALGYEMSDDMTTAIEWAQKAKDHAYKVEKVASKNPSQRAECTYYNLADIHLQQLQKRADQVAKLKVQMGQSLNAPQN